MANTLFTLKNRLPLVITTGLLAGQPIIPLYAAQPDGLPVNTQWNCSTSSDGGWLCDQGTRDIGPLKPAPRMPITPSRQNRLATSVTVETETVTAVEKLPEAAVATGIATTAATVTAVTNEPPAVMKTLDWVSLTALPIDRQSDRNALLCEGGYLEPERPGMDYIGDPADAPILAAADASTYQEEGFGTLKGNVVINQGYRQIESDVAKLNRNENIADFEGNVVIREPNLLMTGDDATVNMTSGRAEITDAQYVFHQERIRGQASKIVRRENGVINMDDASYTTCPPEGCVWELKGQEVELNPLTGFGTAKHATVRVQDVPVFYTPYIYFPIDDRRQTGLLYPTIGFGDSDIGFDYTQPWYWNIAPNYDATITPRYMSKRGLMLENEFRYLTEDAKGEIGGAFLSKDQLKDENRNYDEDRWLLNWRHEQQLSTNWDYKIDFANASDKDILSDFGTGLKLGSQSPLNQQITSTYYGGGDSAHQWRLTANFEKLKNMSIDSDDPYNREPQLTLLGDWDMGAGFGFNYLVDYTEFDRDKDWNYKRKVKDTDFDKEYDIERPVYGEGYGINNAVGQRLYLQSGVKYRLDRTYGFVEPSVGFSHVGYDLNRLDLQEVRDQMGDQSLSKNDIDSPSTTAPFYALDSGLFFERDAAFGDMKFVQTLEPRAKYLYVPYRSQQSLNPSFDTSEMSFSYDSLWRNSRFSGYDRIGDTNQLALGVTSRFLEDDGYERFRFGIGQIFYFQKRKAYLDPTLNVEENPDYNQSEAQRRLIEDNEASTSPLATQLVWNIRRDLNLRQDWMFNTNRGHIDEYALGLHYLPKQNHALNFRYRYRDQVDRTVKNDDGNNIWIDPTTGAVVPPGTPGAVAKTTSGNLEEVDASFLMPLTTNWNTVGRWTYDITNSRSMERSFGVERESCCYKVQVLYRNWIDPYEDIDTASSKHGVFVQFVLKGLGSLTGTKVESFLQDIDGYRPEE
ncbi:LPS-assembly protein LptD [Kistimonas asteriae]|uniref:LPS-assembly protein LptD n=1 Tax=Kistimonas asteriae TaxID=517724 RepID=UPI001BA92066|nr:LPS-assembly protein LptD [Kistimonas asteriae]